jgi:hypothetical protein
VATEKKVDEVTAQSEDQSLAEYPGRTLGVVALVLSFFLQIPGLIMGIIAWVWSNKVGRSNVPANGCCCRQCHLDGVGHFGPLSDGRPCL